LLAIVDDVNRANSETAMTIFLSQTIAPEIKRMVDKINEEMTYEDFGEEFVLDFEDPTPENRELELKEYESGLQNNYLLINEVRQREGLPPVNGGWSFYMSIANTPVGGLPQSGTVKHFSIEEINADSKKNEKILEKAKSEEKPKLYSFKGRGIFKKKLEMYEEMKKIVEAKLSEKKKKKGKKEKKGTPMFLTEGSKNAYANYINKKIDVKVVKLKDATDAFFKQQSERVIAKLEKQKSKDVTVKVTEIFDKASEGKIAINFIMPFIEEFIKASAKDALSMIAPAEDFNDTARIQKLIEKRAEFFAESVNSTTLEKLGATLSEGISNAEGIADLTKRVSEMYDTFPTYRSELVARTEATASNNEGLLEGFKQSSVATGKEWINAGDDRVRDEHQDVIGVGGEIVGLEESFSNGLKYPQEPNCRCVIGPAFLE
jgi:SPP1 gp7 family putative phage head morphogenesis protein